jgi:hypothetical protein
VEVETMRVAGLPDTRSAAPVPPLGLRDSDDASAPGLLGVRTAVAATSLPFAEITEVWVLSDYKVVHTATPITKAGGTLVPEPAWPDGLVVCHPMDTHIEVLVTLEFSGTRSLHATLVGRGSGLEFEKRVKLRPGENRFTLQSSAKLSNQVQRLDVELYWYFEPSTRVFLIPALVTFAIFATAGEPRSDEADGVTAQRLAYAVKWVAAAKSLDPFEIISFIVNARFSDFDLRLPRAPWELALQNSRADCRSLVNHMLAVIDMVGLREAAKDVQLEAVKLWEHHFNIAVESIPGHIDKKRFKWMPDKGNFISMETPADEKKDLNFPELYHPTRSLIRVLLFDRDDRPNAFQACLKYTDRSRTVYFPGGVKRTFEAKFSGAAHREAVLRHVFKSLAWAKPDIEGDDIPKTPVSWKRLPHTNPIKSYD